MLRSLQMAKKAMQIQQSRVDVLANNLANAATTGFRQVLTQVQDPGATGANNPGADGMALPQGLVTTNSAVDRLVVGNATDARRGAIMSTGNGTDVALKSRGYFVVQDPEGNELYTRAGNFHLDQSGRLVTPGGDQVQSTGGPIEVGRGTLEILDDGTVTVDGAARGRLRVVDFATPARLVHRGDSLLAAPEDMAAEDVPATEVAALQGHLEGSNVDPVRTLVDMIAAQRAFEVQSKVLQASDENLQKSVNNLSAVRG